MIVLDTNVLTEPMRQQPDPHVSSWLDEQFAETLFLTTITLAEVRFGIAVLPAGARRDRLAQRFEEEILPFFAGRLLPFDESASAAYARIRADARASGNAIATVDGYIAAIARANDLAVATRDTAPFTAAGLQVINPFAA